ncbi:hypothetical protein [Loktanella atrilutea]|uniref:hypothetical protein n=1 Tax=Loktanella atrilutea TaxID=366533 RepID=UPI001160668E|nr:hypothetical protein [Loktanella atrilutea]
MTRKGRHIRNDPGRWMTGDDGFPTSSQELATTATRPGPSAARLPFVPDVRPLTKTDAKRRLSCGRPDRFALPRSSSGPAATASSGTPPGAAIPSGPACIVMRLRRVVLIVAYGGRSGTGAPWDDPF